jgi:hypothetical protein
MTEMIHKLQNIFGKYTEAQATFKVQTLATHFLDTTNIYIPHTPFDKLNPGLQLVKDYKKITKIKKEAEVNIQDKNKARVRSTKRAKHIIRCNTFEDYVTFTFAEDRYDFDKCLRKMETWLENQKKRIGHFEYVIVIEFHKDGAIHFHALFQGYKGKIVPAINPHTGKQLRKRGRLVFSYPAYTLGHMEVYKCKTNQKDRSILEYYLNKLEKYLTKEQSILPTNRKRFWTTRGLKRPQLEYNPAWYTPDMKPVWKNDNEWGTTLIFTHEQIRQARDSKKVTG